MLKTLTISTVLLPIRYSQERLVSGRLARERQLLHPLGVRNCEHPGINGAFK
jgi:hypothetical protein